LEQERQAELQTANAQLRESEAALERRVAERTQELSIAKEGAEKAQARAEKADQVKSQFLASMSHELRTPLNAIINFTEMTALGMVGPVTEEQKDILLRAVTNSHHLLSLINDVLDITKIQSGKLTLFIETGINLYEELETAAVTTEALLQDKPVRLVRDVAGDLPLISGDKRRVRQILFNLLSNAARFTEEGTITLTASRQDDDSVLFAVTDTGPGIAIEQQALIFVPFIQTEAGLL
jgi:signal transduction histidine kinase